LGVIATMTAELWKGYPNPLVQIAITLAGAVYVGIGLGGFYGVHEYFFIHAAMAQTAQSVPDLVQTAAYFTIAMLASIWICDSAAFAVGRKIGKHKIAARVSPNKSWEGGIAGLMAAILVWFAVRAFAPPLYNISIVTCIAMGLIVGVFGQIGDFAESLIKRDAGVKDSSTLIPGHGGVLDRLDSILFVAPLTYLYLHLFGA
jgi:phosphatidate cytidylyltransferase